MTTGGKRPPLREQLSLFESTVAREGTTTGAGNVAGNTIIDAGLIGIGANSFLSMLITLYPGDFNNVDSADVTAFNNANGEITFDHPYKNVAAAIPAGVRYKIVTFRFVPAEVAALTALVTALMADVGDPTGETLPSLATKWGDIARSLDLILGDRWDAAGDLGDDIALLLATGIAVQGTVSDAGPAITDFDTDLTEATDNHYNGMLLMFLNGPNIGQAHVIDDYGGAAKNVSFRVGDQWTDVPGDGNSFVILPSPAQFTRALNAVPGADSALNVHMSEVIGNKTDTELLAYTAADSMMRYIKGLITLNDPLAGGRAQPAATTIDLNQAAGTYDLFTGTTQVVILESLNIKMPNIVCGGALTSISIQTDDVTPGVIISAADGAVANLTAEADLGWTGTLYITVGTKIRLTIAGGAHGVAYVCNVTAKCRAVVAGGNLA